MTGSRWHPQAGSGRSDRRARRAASGRTVMLLVASFAACFSAGAAERQRPSNAEILFQLSNACPSTGATHGACPGYVIDRVIPIVCGGADEPDNMQWQTTAEAKEKDRWERIGCRRGRKLVLPGESVSITEAFATRELPAGVEAQPLPKSP